MPTTMERNLKDALQHRRSYYELTPESPIDDAKIEEIIHFAIRHIPSAFNSQSTRLVLLLHEQHKAFWEIVKRTLQAIIPAEAFVATEQKIDRSFASGYGTVLYYEDTTVVRKLQEQFPTYADNFPIWSEHTSAMHQLAVWTMLEDAGFGASLQHYNPLIDNEVRKRWSLPEEWRLIAQMPFGTPAGEPGEKPCTIRLGGPTCLAGDVVGDYSFDAPLAEGDRLIFGDMAIYTTCKNNTFNGMPLPPIWAMDENGTCRELVKFGYSDFKMRLGRAAD